MSDWIITLPKTILWSDYEKEIEAVRDRTVVMNYKLPFRSSAKPGDRCFVTHCGKVRGWMEIVGVEEKPMFICLTTGKCWKAAYYLVRSGPFHYTDGPEYPGFRGIRKYEG